MKPVSPLLDEVESLLSEPAGSAAARSIVRGWLRRAAAAEPAARPWTRERDARSSPALLAALDAACERALARATAAAREAATPRELALLLHLRANWLAGWQQRIAWSGLALLQGLMAAAQRRRRSARR